MTSEADVPLSQGSDEQAVREAENARFDALVAGDFDAFGALSHADLRYTHSSAVVDDLESYLRKCRAGFYVYHSITHPIDKITIIGDVALVFGEMRAKLTVDGTEKELDNRSLAVWTRSDDQWLLLAFQPTVKPAAAIP